MTDWRRSSDWPTYARCVRAKECGRAKSSSSCRRAIWPKFPTRCSPRGGGVGGGGGGGGWVGGGGGGGGVGGGGGGGGVRRGGGGGFRGRCGGQKWGFFRGGGLGVPLFFCGGGGGVGVFFTG